MLSLKGALALYGLCFATLLVVGSTLAAYGVLGLAAAEWLCVGLPTIAAFAVGPERAAAALGVTRAPALAWIGAALTGASAWIVVGMGIAPIVERFAPMPRELVEALERAANPGGPLWLPLVSVAATPAICEELLCRGALLPPLRERLGARLGVVIAALLFAVLHLSPYRFLPTFLLGLSFGALAVGARSTLPAMLAHAINNAALVILASDGGQPLRAALEGHAPVAVAVAVVVLTIGHTLVHFSRRR